MLWKREAKEHKLSQNFKRGIWLKEGFFLKLPVLAMDKHHVCERLSLWLKLISVHDKAETFICHCSRPALAVINTDNEDEEPASSKNSL